MSKPMHDESERCLSLAAIRERHLSLVGCALNGDAAGLAALLLSLMEKELLHAQAPSVSGSAAPACRL